MGAFRTYKVVSLDIADDTPPDVAHDHISRWLTAKLRRREDSRIENVTYSPLRVTVVYSYLDFEEPERISNEQPEA